MNSDNSLTIKLIRGSFLFSLSLTLIVLAVVAGDISFWHVQKEQMVSGSIVFVAPALLLLLMVLLWLKEDYRRLFLDPRAFVCGLFFLFLSDWLTRGYSFLPGPLIRGEIIFGFFLAFIFFYKFVKKGRLGNLLVVVAALFFFSFVNSSNGQAIFSDDHSVFLYRLQLLKQNFPDIPVYNPMWSAGRDTLHLFATGTLNVFFLFLPIIYLFPLESCYSWIVAAILFILTPGATYLAAQFGKLSPSTSAIAGFLSLSASALWYQWALKYGTIGFVTSIALLPLVLMLGFVALLGREDLNWKKSTLLVFATCLMLFWSPSGLVFIPALFIGIKTFSRQWRKPKFISAVVIVTLLTLPWMVFFWQEWQVSRFLGKSDSITVESSDTESGRGSANIVKSGEASQVKNNSSSSSKSYRFSKSGLNLSESLANIREVMIRVNPLLILLTIPGLSLLRRSLRWPYACTLVWLLLLGAVFSPLLPQLELDRMLIVMVQLSCIPAALVFDVFLNRRDLFGHRFAGGLVFSFLFSGIIATAGIASNQAEDRFSFAGNELATVRQFFKDMEIFPKGRILFSGFLLHDLDGGHLAPLPGFIGIPSLGVSHLHDQWEYKQIFPAEVLKGRDSEILAYLDFYNVEILAAHDRKWIAWFSDRGNYFRQIGKAGKFIFFRREQFVSNYFLEGSGEIVSQSYSGVKLQLTSPEAELKFRYHSHLQSECLIEPGRLQYEMRTIKLSNCPLGSEVSIKAKPFFQRLVASNGLDRSIAINSSISSKGG